MKKQNEDEDSLHLHICKAASQAVGTGKARTYWTAGRPPEAKGPSTKHRIQRHRHLHSPLQKKSSTTIPTIGGALTPKKSIYHYPQPLVSATLALRVHPHQTQLQL